MAYVFERQSQLRVFLSNPDVATDTNHLERSLRVIPMGRKNYLFCWSELGAEQLGILQSLMVTCRIQGTTHTLIWLMYFSASVYIQPRMFSTWCPESGKQNLLTTRCKVT
ncbi:MAG: hypothetical protein ACJA13_004199 [Paraglaciecola sp.]|jgi:hypothetical protein